MGGSKIVMVNSKQKGKRGEREVVQLLKKFGIKARRGQQFKGTKDSPDVICNRNWHIEVKFREKLNIYTAHDQAIKEAPLKKTPLVFHRKIKRPWYVTLTAEDFLRLMQLKDTIFD